MAQRARDRSMYEFAKRGAEVHFRQLLYETRLLLELFPHLRDSFDKDELPLTFIMAQDSGTLASDARHRAPAKLAAGREGVNARKKKYGASTRRSTPKA